MILIKNAENGPHSARFMSGNASYILILGQCMQVVMGDRPVRMESGKLCVYFPVIQSYQLDIALVFCLVHDVCVCFDPL